jgi:hypothetical protein
VVYAVALALRWRELDAVRVLSDGIGPWLVAIADPFWPRPHAAPYGWALYPPYAASLLVVGSLAQAEAILLALHALVAPMGLLAVLALRPRARVAAVLVGLLLALDGNLMATARSGAEGYLGPLWVGIATFGVASRAHRWGPPLALLSLAIAFMNHPFAACAVPLVALLPWRAPRTWVGLGLALLALVPSAIRLAQTGLPNAGGASAPPLDAVPVWLHGGGPAAWLVLVAPLAALAHRETRPLGLAVLAGALSMAVAGVHGDYLKDHYLRLLSVPAAVCLASLPWQGGLFALLLLRVPHTRVPPAGAPPVPASLAQETALVERIQGLPRPLLVDGAVVSGAPAVEPAAAMLDLHLRGWARTDFGPGGTVVLVVSGNPEDLARIPGMEAWWDGHSRHLVLVGTAAELRTATVAFCAVHPRTGGFQDGLAVLRPELEGVDPRAWWADCL